MRRENECRCGGSCGRLAAITDESAPRRGMGRPAESISRPEATLSVELPDASTRATASKAGSRAPFIPPSVLRSELQVRSSIPEQVWAVALTCCSRCCDQPVVPTANVRIPASNTDRNGFTGAIVDRSASPGQRRRSRLSESPRRRGGWRHRRPGARAHHAALPGCATPARDR